MKAFTSAVLASVLAQNASAFASFGTPSHSAPSTVLMAYRQSYQHQLDVITGNVAKNGVTVKPNAAPSAPVNGGSYIDGLEVPGTIPLNKEEAVYSVEQKTVEPTPTLDVDSSMDELMFENFILKRELSMGEAISLVERILLCATEEVVRREFMSEGRSHVETTIKQHASITTDAEGKFTLDDKQYQIGYTPGKFGTLKSLWKDDSSIKIEQDQFGTRSVKYWFEQVGFEPRYNVNAKAVIREMFAKEL